MLSEVINPEATKFKKLKLLVNVIFDSFGTTEN